MLFMYYFCENYTYILTFFACCCFSVAWQLSVTVITIKGNILTLSVECNLCLDRQRPGQEEEQLQMFEYVALFGNSRSLLDTAGFQCDPAAGITS